MKDALRKKPTSDALSSIKLNGKKLMFLALNLEQGKTVLTLHFCI